MWVTEVNFQRKYVSGGEMSFCMPQMSLPVLCVCKKEFLRHEFLTFLMKKRFPVEKKEERRGLVTETHIIYPQNDQNPHFVSANGFYYLKKTTCQRKAGSFL